MFTRICLFLLAVSSIVFAAEYQADSTADNTVKFVAEATFGTFEGVTDAIKGYVKWKDMDMAINNEFRFQVDLATLDTGIGLRNKHMRNKYLETDKYPHASYKGKIVGIDSTETDTLLIKVKGTFSVHGVQNTLSIEGKAVPTDNGYFAKAGFKLNLRDYDIKKPRFLITKVNNIIKIKVAFYVRRV